MSTTETLTAGSLTADHIGRRIAVPRASGEPLAGILTKVDQYPDRPIAAFDAFSGERLHQRIEPGTQLHLRRKDGSGWGIDVPAATSVTVWSAP